MLTATGVRAGELAGIRYDPGDPRRSDLDLMQREITVRGKGGRQRIVRIGHQAARTLDRYLRARARHAQARRPELWLGLHNPGPMTANRIYQMIARRGRQGGIDVWPHRFRHHFSHTWQIGRIASDATFPEKRDHDAAGDAGRARSGVPAPMSEKQQVRAACEHGIAAGESMLHLIRLHLKAARCSYCNVKIAATREDAPGGQSPR